MFVNVTEAEQKELVKLYLDGNSIREISELKGFSYHVIRKYLAQHQVTVSNRILNDLESQKICDLYLSEPSLRKVAAKSGVSTKVVYNTIRRNNIPTKYPNKIYRVNESYFDKVDTWEKAYILGFVYADGHIGRNRYNFCISVQERDAYILNKMKNSFDSSHPIWRIERSNIKHQNSLGLSIVNKRFCQGLIKQGVMPGKAFKIVLPQLKNELIFAFILGYFDGDGYFSIDKRRRSTGSLGICSNKKFCQQIKKKLLEFNINSKVYTHSTRNLKSAEVRIGTYDGLNKLFTLMYGNASMYLVRKYDKLHNFLGLKNDNF